MEHLNISISTILLLLLDLDLLLQPFLPFPVWGSPTEKSARMLVAQYLGNTRTIKGQYNILQENRTVPNSKPRGGLRLGIYCIHYSLCELH
jgi:hypothetical protein